MPISTEPAEHPDPAGAAPSSLLDPPHPPSIGPEMVDALEDVERRAMVDVVAGASAALRTRLGLEVERRAGLTAIRSAGVDSLLFNRLYVSATEPVRREDLEALLHAFARSGIERYLVHVPPPVSQSDLPSWLEAQHVTPFRRHWVKFLRGTEAPPRSFTDLHVRPAEARDADAHSAIITRAFEIPDAAMPLWAGVVGRPGWHVFVACEGDTPVASGMLFTRGKMSYLAGAATLPSHQRRGAQGALLEARLTAAREAGSDHVVSETGVRLEGAANVSYRNMVRIGLSPAYLRLNYAPRGTTWAPS